MFPQKNPLYPSALDFFFVVADEHKTIAGVLMAGAYDRALPNTNYLKKGWEEVT
jgi:hypothetical protein